MWRFSLGLALGAVAFGSAVHGQQDPKLYAGLKWRSIGPFRAGRASAVGGVAGNPAVYYMGTPGGGVWKTTDGGMIWKPMSDALPVASIGALAVAPSNPDVVYIGTGDVSEVGGSVNAGIWRLQIDRCGRNVDARRPRGHVAHRSPLDRSARSECRRRRSAGPHLRERCGPGHLQDDRRRRELEKDALQRRGNGGD